MNNMNNLEKLLSGIEFDERDGTPKRNLQNRDENNVRRTGTPDKKINFRDNNPGNQTNRNDRPRRSSNPGSQLQKNPSNVGGLGSFQRNNRAGNSPSHSQHNSGWRKNPGNQLQNNPSISGIPSLFRQNNRAENSPSHSQHNSDWRKNSGNRLQNNPSYIDLPNSSQYDNRAGNSPSHSQHNSGWRKNPKSQLQNSASYVDLSVSSQYNNHAGNSPSHSQHNSGWRKNLGNQLQNNRRNSNTSHDQFDNNRAGNSSAHSQHNSGKNFNNARRPLGFKKLEEISQQDPIQILQFFSDSRNFEVFSKTDLKLDFIILLMRCVGKMCLAEFDTLKGQTLVQICKSQFLKMLKNYIMGLHHTKIVDKRHNMMFWNDLDSFFKDLFSFCQSIIELSPSTAVDEFKTLFDVMTMSIQGLQTHQKERFTEEVMEMFEELQIKFAVTLEEEERKAETAVIPSQSKEGNQRNLHLETPPDDFRDIEILPTKNDLFHKPNFLRPNIINGAYLDVDHYLDVQFRLMREDFISPLRDAISDYMKDDRKKRRYGSAKFHHNVKITSYCETREGMGVELLYDEKLYRKFKSKKNNERPKNMKSKRFLYGSLLLLVKKDFDEILFSTVIDSDNAQYGTIVASLDPEHLTDKLFNETFLMIESDIYFAPYLHILEMLKRPALAESFPFEEYIIHAQVLQERPVYLRLDDYKLFNNCQVKDGEWPTAEQLGLDASQYNAYKTALTREFVTIQGPPGTGKTFVGLKVAETLLQNLYLNNATTNPMRQGSPILVVCYTNHALDQFLEGLLPFTQSLIRVGGQSKNETLKQFNLKNQKKNLNPSYFEHRDTLRFISSMSANTRQCLNIINSPVEMYDVTQDIEGVDFNKFFEKYNYPDASIPPLLYWLTMADKIFNSKINYNLQQYNNKVNVEEEQMSEEDEYEDVETDEDTDDIHRQEIDLGDELDVKTPDECIASSVNIVELRKRALEIEKELTMYETRGGNVKEIESNRQINALRFNTANIIEERLKRGDVGYPANVIVGDRGELYDLEQRWALYWMWHREVKQRYTTKLNNYTREFNQHKSICDELNQAGHLGCLRKAHVVGVTTSGAARLQSLLRTLRSPIVIVEEAAEVMETHVIVSLTSSCQHLIMIGDHQQLRPITASYNLAKRYNLDISLFERMVKNGSQCLQLSVQHRMRPEISKLITPAIYPELQDHPSVHDYPHVLGVRKNLFFLDHTVHERMVEDSVSRLNEHEAHFALSLAKYFVQQGYDPSDITILATYSGQMFYIREQRRNVSLLKNVHVVVLDNYQGEENKIIILSLVRSNAEGNIGFLSTANRVCVALSRAKHGFYMIGNMSNLKVKSPLWRQVLEVLEAQEAFGDNLELQCQIHRDVITPVKTANDFTKVAEGGCQSACNRLLECGHYCKKLCHIYDIEHKTYPCREKCDKIICDFKHKCQGLCFEKCKCMIIVTRTLPCDHELNLPCSTDYKTVKCQVLVDDVLPLCSHKVKRPCHMKVEDVMCPEACEDRLPCGHSCRRRCHKKPSMDPDHLQYLCMMDCVNLNNDCSQNHKCKKRCHEKCSECTIKVSKPLKCGHIMFNVECHVKAEDIVCPNKCKRSLPCGHHCKSMCKEPCDPAKCQVKVRKVRSSCGHELEIACGIDPNEAVCRNPCDRIMSCGHKCKGRCNVKCDVEKCKEMIPNMYGSVCGHSYKIPCKDRGMDPNIGKMMTMQYCDVPCNAILKGCEHSCSGTCGKCWAGALHVPCAEPCGNILVCGHPCKDPCRLACPPCKVKCEVKCLHSKCPKTCGVPCPTCKEPCKRSCEHGKCNKLCGEECSLPSCSEGCKKTLECGHPCRGLCGEKCPDVCKVCKPDYPDILFGTEDDDDARFIQLIDCQHVLEVDGMDTCMEPKDDGSICVGKCPLCTSKVTNTPRYADQVKRMQRRVQAAKIKVFGDPKDIENGLRNLEQNLNALENSAKHVASDPNWTKHFRWLSKIIEKHLAPIKNKQNRHNAITVCLTDVEAFQAQFEVLQQISDMFKEPDTLSCVYVQRFIKGLLEAVISTDTVKSSSNKVSEQQCEDFNRQLTKLNTLVLATELEFLPKDKWLKKESAMQELMKIKSDIFFDVRPFDDGVSNKYKEMLNTIRKSMSLSPITAAERKMIVAAMNFKQGHWYTCQNGHPYCIADCGGAVVVSKCPECGCSIGGTGHALLSSNRVATFMDGAKHGAWPGNYNMQDYGDMVE